MSNFEKLLAVLADNPAIAEKIVADCTPLGGADATAVDPTRITAGLLSLAREHGIVLSEAELRQGLARTALDRKAELIRLMKDQGTAITEAELERGLSQVARADGTLSDADLEQVTGGIVATTILIGCILGLAGVGMAGTVGGLLAGYFCGKKAGSDEERARR